MLHACCGPCLLEPYDALSHAGDVQVLYTNSNIQPLGEYERRRDTLLAYARERGIPVELGEYAPETWDEAVGGVEHQPGVRCRECFRLRLGEAARRAAETGCEAVATTLTVSPYQDHDAIREVGEEVCAAAGVVFLVTDYRDRYPDAVRRSRELGMYRQNYCGCRYSDEEAREEREARRARRAAEARS